MVPRSSVEASSESISSPRSLYISNCARCHSANGTSQTALGRKLDAEDLTGDRVKGDSIEKISRVIANGKGDMPGFKKKLTAAQIAQIAAFVKTL